MEKTIIKQEVNSLSVLKFSNLVTDVVIEFEKVKNSGDCQSVINFISQATDVLADFEDVINDEVGYLPGIFRDDLKRIYSDLIEKASKLISKVKQ